MSATEPPAGGRGTIVIAEDDAATRQLLCRVLQRAAFTVYAVKNGKLACEAVRLRRPDVILLDWVMPVMDGLHAAELLKADVTTRAIPIVMITTHSQIEDRHLALGAGVQDFVTKPFDSAELLACVDQQRRWRTIVVGARGANRRCAPIENAHASRNHRRASDLEQSTQHHE
jgi:DNA-binding response OmpR family regulator